MFKYMFSKSPNSGVEPGLKFENQFEFPEFQKSEPYLYIFLDPQLVSIIDCVITSRLISGQLREKPMSK